MLQMQPRERGAQRIHRVDDWIDASLKVIEALRRQLSEEPRIGVFAADSRDVFHHVAAVFGELRYPA